MNNNKGQVKVTGIIQVKLTISNILLDNLGEGDQKHLFRNKFMHEGRGLVNRTRHDLLLYFLTGLTCLIEYFLSM